MGAATCVACRLRADVFIRCAQVDSFTDSGAEAPLKRSNKVLCFYAYFMEAVHDSYLENFRVRRCEIYYYLEDDSMQIVEPKQENSGVPQGNFMKRHRVPKSEDDYFTIIDIDVGCSIEL